MHSFPFRNFFRRFFVKFKTVLEAVRQRVKMQPCRAQKFYYQKSIFRTFEILKSFLIDTKFANLCSSLPKYPKSRSFSQFSIKYKSRVKANMKTWKKEKPRHDV